jgi:hypothetical protein
MTDKLDKLTCTFNSNFVKKGEMRPNNNSNIL